MQNMWKENIIYKHNSVFATILLLKHRQRHWTQSFKKNLIKLINSLIENEKDNYRKIIINIDANENDIDLLRPILSAVGIKFYNLQDNCNKIKIYLY